MVEDEDLDEATLMDLIDFNIISCIPFFDDEKLYWAVHKDKWSCWDEDQSTGELIIQPNVFNLPTKIDDGMSVDRELIGGSPERCLTLKNDPSSETNGIIQIKVVDIRLKGKDLTPRLRLKYKPEIHPKINLAHSLILNLPLETNNKAVKNKVRTKLLGCSSLTWAIKPDRTSLE